MSKRKDKSGTDGADDAAVATQPEVHAAGGVVLRRVRRGVRGRDQVVVVHRPRYDDWSFPKGKRDASDADDAATALREVEEETGIPCVLGPEIGETRYRDSRGRSKVVRYWLMTPAASDPLPEFVPNREVDELVWCTKAEAGRLLTYEHDRELLERLGERSPRGDRKARTASGG